MRLDGNGDVVWDKTFGDEKDTAAGSIAALPDSGFAAVGLTRSPEASNARIMRLDADGRLLWEKAIPTRGLPAKYLFNRASLAALPDGVLCLWTKSNWRRAGPGTRPSANAARRIACWPKH